MVRIAERLSPIAVWGWAHLVPSFPSGWVEGIAVILLLWALLWRDSL